MKEELSTKTRTESDLIGSREIPESAMYGVQSAYRAANGCYP